MLTVDDWDGQTGLDGSTEVEAAGFGSESVDQDNVGVFEFSAEKLNCRRWAFACGHCKERQVSSIVCCYLFVKNPLDRLNQKITRA